MPAHESASRQVRQLMVRFLQANPSPTQAKRKPILLLGLCWLFAAAAWAAPAKRQELRITGAEAQAAAGKPAPEALLIEVYKEIGANDMQAAQEKAQSLAQAHPDFGPGQLVRSDLLLHAQPARTAGAAGASRNQRKKARDEALLRLRALRERPDPGLMPRAVLQMRDDQKHVLAVDARRSRLYVYANQRGQLKFVSDYYVSQGRICIFKSEEGDYRTPVGIYYITSHLPDALVPEFYGASALPVSYPGESGKADGDAGQNTSTRRTPSTGSSQMPLSAEGCVVLATADLQQLAEVVEIGKTPVLIAESLAFVSKTRRENERRLAARLVDDWRRDVESLSGKRVLANYSRHFKSERGEDIKTWFNKPQQSFRNAKSMVVRLRDETHYFYPGRDDLIVSTFTQESRTGNSTSSVRKRQYWSRERGHWKIIRELTL